MSLHHKVCLCVVNDMCCYRNIDIYVHTLTHTHKYTNKQTNKQTNKHTNTGHTVHFAGPTCLPSPPHPHPPPSTYTLLLYAAHPPPTIPHTLPPMQQWLTWALTISIVNAWVDGQQPCVYRLTCVLLDKQGCVLCESTVHEDLLACSAGTQSHHDEVWDKCAFV